MDLLVFILVYPIIWLISILPFRLLYLFSDFLYAILYYVVGYRKKVVLDNLKIAFPNKEEKELLKIRKQFYHHFIDIFMEMIKSFTISEKQLIKHYSFTNLDMVNELYKNKKSTIIMGAHYANWEWIMGLNKLVAYRGYAAYTKISNKYFNQAILKSRSKQGVILKQTSKVIKEMELNKRENIQSMYGLLSDQSPQIKKTHYWTQFFGVKVPVHTGAEMLAKRYDMNLIFMNTQKVKRGYYETTFELLTDSPSDYKNYEITDMYLRKVEEMITKNPSFYFWTHKRFKHKDKAPEGSI